MIKMNKFLQMNNDQKKLWQLSVRPFLLVMRPGRVDVEGWILWLVTMIHNESLLMNLWITLCIPKFLELYCWVYKERTLGLVAINKNWKKREVDLCLWHSRHNWRIAEKIFIEWHFWWLEETFAKTFNSWNNF